MRRIRTGATWDVPPPLDRVLDRLWRVTLHWSVNLEGTLTWFCSDDSSERERKFDYELRVPRVLWRPYCAWRGKHEEYYGRCVFCDVPMAAPTPPPAKAGIDKDVALVVERTPHSYETVMEFVDIAKRAGVGKPIILEVLYRTGPEGLDALRAYLEAAAAERARTGDDIR